MGRLELPKVEIRCPKCGSSAVERTKNQECRCCSCGEVFYFVTPRCGSQAEDDLGRYEL
jgi:ribosomal protein L37AE/L43A